MRKSVWYLVLVLLLCFNNSVLSQTESDSTLYNFRTLDGNEYIGSILRQTEDSIFIKTEYIKELAFAKVHLKSMVKISQKQLIDNKYWFENPQATRYFWAPNGYGLKKDESYYQNVWIFFNQFAYGLTDNFSLGLGLVPVFLFGDTSSPFWITPKFSIPIVEDKVNIGLGALLGTVVGQESSGFGVIYGMVTFGSRDLNVSTGIGYGYAGGNFANMPTLNFSVLARTNQNSYFISENYFFPSDDGNLVTLSLGGRRIVKRVGIDYGFYIPLRKGMDRFMAIPWLGLVIPFGNK